MEFFQKKDHPMQVSGESHSVEVFTCDASGLLNLAFYDYDSEIWCFHAETVNNYDDMDFVWMYPPKDLFIKAGFRN